MLNDFLPFQIDLDTTMLAGCSLWSLALYLTFTSIRESIIQGLERWFNFAERSLYTSAEEFEKTRPARESQNSFYASLFSIIPFFIVGALCNWGVVLGLGRSWAISLGILTCMTCGIYQLGRQDNDHDE